MSRENDDGAGRVRVVIVDDQELVRAGLDMLLAGDSGVEVLVSCRA